MLRIFRRLALGVFFCLLASPALAAGKGNSAALSHYIMALLRDKQGESGQAIEEFRKALEFDQDNILIRLNLAASFIKANQLDKAIAELKTASVRSPEAIEPHALLALLYSLQDKQDLATGEYEAALKNASKQQPKNSDIYKALGIIYLEQNRLKEAAAAYKMATELKSDDADAHFVLGDIYYELRELDLAEKELLRCIELKPDFDPALNFLGYLYAESNRNLPVAEQLIRKALSAKPDSGAYIDSLGWVYFRLGKYKEALREIERASTLENDPVIFDHLGDVYLKLSDREKARLNWEKSLALNPHQSAVKEKIEKLNRKQNE